MRQRFIFVLLSSFFLVSGKSQSSFSKAELYAAMASEDLGRLNDQINRVQGNMSLVNRTAYLGALHMKKAGLSGQTSEKLRLFKAGHFQLESAIKKDPRNPELRFLRLMIQENSPKILKYHDQLSEDASYLRENYKKLDESARQALLNYSQTSKILPAKDLNDL